MCQACLTAITMATDQDMMQIQLESDSLVLVKAFKSTKHEHLLAGILFKESNKFFSSMELFASVE